MIHGAFAGGWCFDSFRAVFDSLGWKCLSPDLRGHGARRAAEGGLRGIGLADYRSELAAQIGSLPEPPLLLGHSMGAVLAQQLAAEGLARGLVLVCPAPRAGILPSAAGEKLSARGLMSLGPFWDMELQPSFEIAASDSLNRIPTERRREVFDRFGPESGRALFELFCWMFDDTGASAVDVAAIRCPVLCLSGSDDRLISRATVRAVAAPYGDAVVHELPGHGHMMPVEPEAERVAQLIADWAATVG
jgi:pimeloyl-ACP methyl ester carboxylesterase